MRLPAALAAVCLLTATTLAQTPSAPPPTPIARHPEAGGLLIRNYPPEAYAGGAQNWVLLQDARGVIYVGSTTASLQDLTSHAHALLHGSTADEKYVTAALLELAPGTGRASYVSAGHINSLLVRKGGDVVSLASTGAPLGLLPPGMPYDTTAITIEPGDCLILCSDGVPDAQNEGDDEFGEHRLTAIVQDARHRPSAEIVSRVFDAIDQFAGAAPQFDDITLMVLRRL